MRLFIASFLLVAPALASAKDEFPTYAAYLSAVTGRPTADLVVVDARWSSPRGVTIVGAVHPRSQVEPTGRPATVFVLEQDAGNEVREVVRSRQFDFLDPSGRTDIEAVEAQSETRFSLQINMRSVCGVHIDVYRFAKARGQWYVSGRDSTRVHCSEDDEAVGDTRDERSSNFLTGRSVERTFRNNKLANTRQRKTAPLKYPLAEFSAFDEKYDLR